MGAERQQLLRRSDAPLSDCLMGHVDDPTGMVFSAVRMKRATAISYFAGEWGMDFQHVKCTTAYGRWLTPQHIWDEYGRERWEDEVEDHFVCPKCGAAIDEACDEDGLALPCKERLELVPDGPPEGWEPSDYDPAWEMCKATDDGAQKIYVCEEKPRGS